MCDMELNNLDVTTLRILYIQRTEELRDALLSGLLWNELEMQRNAVTEIGIALHKKLLENGSVSPADFAIRKTLTSEREQDPIG